MGAKTRRKRLLTEVELELMCILWRLREGSVRQVRESLPRDRKLAYTSVSTMLRILENKGALASRKVGRAHVYYPRLSRREYESRLLGHLRRKLFGGDPAAMILRILEIEEMPREALRKIRRAAARKSPARS